MTDEITKSIKRVANEVFDERKKEIIDGLRKVFDDGLENDRSYKGWNELEDHLLLEEFRNAVNTIAKRHGRSFGAVLSRIRKNELTDGRKYVGRKYVRDWKDEIPWDKLSGDIRWVARDSVGSWYGYRNKPRPLTDIWSARGSIKLGHIKMPYGPEDWKEAIAKRP